MVVPLFGSLVDPSYHTTETLTVDPSRLDAKGLKGKDIQSPILGDHQDKEINFGLTMCTGSKVSFYHYLDLKFYPQGQWVDFYQLMSETIIIDYISLILGQYINE